MKVEIDLAESGHLQPLAATRLEWSGAATCRHSLGTVWSSHLRTPAAARLELSGAATCSHLRPLAWNCLERPLAATCGHLRPLAATRVQVAAVAGGCGLEWGLAATCLELAGAATCGHFLGTIWGGHLQPLAATQVAASRCNCLQPCTCFRGLLWPLAPAATCSQSAACW